jgi:hypothetical protein
MPDPLSNYNNTIKYWNTHGDKLYRPFYMGTNEEARKRISKKFPSLGDPRSLNGRVFAFCTCPVCKKTTIVELRQRGRLFTQYEIRFDHRDAERIIEHSNLYLIEGCSHLGYGFVEKHWWDTSYWSETAKHWSLPFNLKGCYTKKSQLRKEWKNWKETRVGNYELGI